MSNNGKAAGCSAILQKKSTPIAKNNATINNCQELLGTAIQIISNNFTNSLNNVFRLQISLIFVPAMQNFKQFFTKKKRIIDNSPKIKKK
jgi:hypothetical protein